jgi:hypothetical protein
MLQLKLQISFISYNVLLVFHDYEKPAHNYTLRWHSRCTSNTGLRPKRCSAYALICGNIECECMIPHRLHQLQVLQGLRQKLHTPADLPEDYAKAEKSIRGFIDSCIASL